MVQCIQPPAAACFPLHLCLLPSPLTCFPSPVRLLTCLEFSVSTDRSIPYESTSQFMMTTCLEGSETVSMLMTGYTPAGTLVRGTLHVLQDQ